MKFKSLVLGVAAAVRFRLCAAGSNDQRVPGSEGGFANSL